MTHIVTGNCSRCGCYPAIELTFKVFASVWVAFHAEHDTKWYCKHCALAVSREFSTRTLVAGWMGIGILFLWWPVWHNYEQAQKAQRLAPPYHPQARFRVHGTGEAVEQPVENATGIPLLPGPPLLRRWTTYIAPTAVMLALIALGSYVWAVN